ncbi:MAG: transporter substrate-binding domain-containing protein, partial [Myxococcota bacterium]
MPSLGRLLSIFVLLLLTACPVAGRGPVSTEPASRLSTSTSSMAATSSAAAALDKVVDSVDLGEVEDESDLAAETEEDRKAQAMASTPPPEEEADPRATVASADVAISKGGLRTIQRRKELRILIPGSSSTYLPRPGLPALDDIAKSEAFARSIGVEPKFVLVEKYEDLIPALIAGRGDVIAAQLTVTRQRARRVSFTRSTLGTAEILVGRAGAENLPTSVEQLDGRQVFVRPSSAYASTLAALANQRGGPKVEIVPVGEHESTEEIVMSVVDDQRALTVADAHLLDAMDTYAEGYVRLFPLTERRQIAWAVRKRNTKLRDALNRYLQGLALTVHTRVTATPDLEGIKKRGVL